MRFFFYGTLMAGSGNPAARLVEEKLRELGPAEACGVLYAVPDPDGWYPVLLPGGGLARGMLYEVRQNFTTADLARLDAYEDYDSARPDASLYIREAIEVIGPDGTCTAEVYSFVPPLPEGARPIPDGDFRAWLAGAGVTAFAPRSDY